MALFHPTSAIAGTLAIPLPSSAIRPRTHRARWPLAVLFALAWPAASAVLFAALGARRIARAGARAIVVTIVLAAAVLPGLAHVSTEAAPVVRSAALAPFTLPGIAWGLAQGGDLHVEGSMFVITNMRAGYGGQAGITIGQVFLTPKSTVRASLLDHEFRHSTQWLIFGGLLPPIYLVASILGGGAEGNIFELAAGLEDGGYVSA